jgi:glutathione S-transferase
MRTTALRIEGSADTLFGKSKMIELYGAGPSRWVKCYWMLKELNVEFEEHVLNLLGGEQKTPPMLALNPFGKAPVFKDGAVTIFESTAIINYLGEKYPQAGLVPKSGTVERAHYDQWISFCVTELEQPLWRITKHKFIFSEGKRSPHDVDLAREEFDVLAAALDKELDRKKFMVGNRFTAADITMAYTLNWAKRFELINRRPNCLRYTSEMLARPSFPAHLYKK